MKLPESIRWRSTGRTLGQGGQATVVEVEDKQGEFSGRYALKGLARGKPRKAYERFSREVDTIKSLSHPNIIRIVDHSKPEADFQFYVMELVEGAVPLKKLIGTQENPFFENALAGLGLLGDLISAIAACEEKGIIHRDLSPANVLVTPLKAPKIIDFGICQTDEHETITLTDEGVGTPSYMAPECEPGAGSVITCRADLYSAAKVMWSAITNQSAFARETPVFTHRSMVSMFPNNPSLWHLHHIFEKTIRSNPNNRWATCEEALKELYYIRFLVASHCPPLELLEQRCPMCGFGKLGSFEQSHAVFGNPNPRGIQALQCTYCGFCFARNVFRSREILAERFKHQ